MSCSLGSRLPEHAPLWARITSAIMNQRMPQALLLVGPPHLNVSAFAHHLAMILLCQETDAPCGTCSTCHLLQADTHPDFQYICPEAKNGTIKIDQIRVLQDDVYVSPKCGQRRIILIEPADRMNVASANALLKILEEPPPTVYFILVAEQLSTLPATILSRCQQMLFPDTTLTSSNYFALGDHYPLESTRGELFSKQHVMLSALCDISERRLSPCTAAAAWTSYDLNDVIWLLYLILAQAIQMRLLQSWKSDSVSDPLVRFAQSQHPVRLIKQLDILNSTLKKLNYNIPINGTLALETILLGFSRNNHDR